MVSLFSEVLQPSRLTEYSTFVVGSGIFAVLLWKRFIIYGSTWTPYYLKSRRYYLNLVVILSFPTHPRFFMQAGAPTCRFITRLSCEGAWQHWWIYLLIVNRININSHAHALKSRSLISKAQAWWFYFPLQLEGCRIESRKRWIFLHCPDHSILESVCRVRYR